MPARHRTPASSRVSRSFVVGPSAWNTILSLSIVAALCMSMFSGAPRVAAESRIKHGMGASGMQITHLGLGPEPRSMNVSARFFRQDGFGPITRIAAGIPWHGAWNVYTPSMPEIENGIYDMTVVADEWHRSSVRIDWMGSGAAAMYTSSAPAVELFAPLVRIEPAGHRSLITVQNTGQSEEIEVEIALFETDKAGVAATARFTVTAELSRTIDLTREPAFEGLREAHPDGFVGTARIRSSGAPVTAHVLTEGEPGANGVYDYAVEPASDSPRTLHIPRFRVAEPGLGGSAGTRSTSVAVGNPGDTPIDVSVVYTGTDGTCIGRTVVTGPHTISPWSSTLLNSALDSGLSPGCAGYATLSSDQPATAVIVDRTERPDFPTAYSAHPAVSERDASTLVHIPLVRNRFLTGYEVTSEIVVTNPGSDPAEVTLIRRTETGVEVPEPCGVCEFTLDPHESRRFEASELGYPVGTYGSAEARADKPIVVIDHDVSLTAIMDSAAFRAHTMPWPTATARPPSLPGPTPTPTPDWGLDAVEHLPLIVENAEVFGPPEDSWSLYFPAALREGPSGVTGG